MRNYRASLGKWQTADPMGYPDGWNALAYCNNGVTSAVDLWGCKCYEDDTETIWHMWKDEMFFDCTSCVFPLDNPSVPESANGDEVINTLKKLDGLKVELTHEGRVYSSQWVHIKDYGYQVIGNYEYEKSHWHMYQIMADDHYACFSKSGLLSVIEASCTTVGAAAAIAAILFPEVAIVGTFASVGGFVAWLGGQIKGNDCKVLLHSEYNGEWLDYSKVEYWHRRIE